MHWLVVDIPTGGYKRLDRGSEKMKFAPSTPPKDSGKHRYIFLLFAQKSKIGGKKASNAKERKGFKVHQYASDNGLGDPLYVNFYRTEDI